MQKHSVQDVEKRFNEARYLRLILDFIKGVANTKNNGIVAQLVGHFIMELEFGY